MDRTPPQVVGHEPQAGAIDVPSDVEITVSFSEGMNETTVGDALFISPAPDEDPGLSWKGRTLKFVLPEGLAENRTYVITLGVNCKDLRNNRMTESYSFAFSTGKKIDEGTIGGQIYRDLSPRMGVDLWAYLLTGDTEPDPAEHRPDFITQSDQGGRFAFDHLGQGRYRIFAVEDLNDDRRFDPADELLAVPAGDVLLSGEQRSVQMMPFRLTDVDTAGPALRRIDVPHSREAVLFFSQKVDSALAVERERYRIVRAEDPAAQLEITAVTLSAKAGDRVALSTLPQEEGERYLIAIEGLYDISGNAIPPEGFMGEFLGNGERDMEGPRVVAHRPADSAQVIAPETSISLDFDEAVVRESVENSLVLHDSTGASVPGRFLWPHGAELIFVPGERLDDDALYMVELDVAGVMDLAGNGLLDSSMVFRFKTMDEKLPGSISGNIDRGQVPDSVHAVIRAYGPDATGGEHLLVCEVQEYRFQGLLPGGYRLGAFLDMDQNGRYQFGCPLPFVPSEPLWVGQDTVWVRSRWETAGVNISFEH